MDANEHDAMSDTQREIARLLPDIIRGADLEKATVRTLQKSLENSMGRDLGEHKNFIRTEVEHFLKGAVTKKRSASDEEGSKGKKAKAQKKTGRGKTKEIVDPTRPKGPKGAYMCFVSARRSQIKDSNPDMTFPDIARALGVEWKTMSEASRHRYEQMAELDKDRYTREMLSYVPLSEEKMQELREQQSRRKAAGGLQVMYHCSPELTQFLGGVKTINRKDLTTKIWQYFRDHDLMDPINKRFIVPDTKLSKLLKLQDGERFLAFTVSRYLNPHLVKKVEN